MHAQTERKRQATTLVRGKCTLRPQHGVGLELLSARLRKDDDLLGVELDAAGVGGQRDAAGAAQERRRDGAQQWRLWQNTA